MGARILDAEAATALLPYGPLAEAVADTLAAKARGLIHAPARTTTRLADKGVLLAMTAADPELAVAKLVTVHPGNPARGLLVSQGEVLAMRSDTGERLGLLDGSAVTARRTAAASLLAARLLAPNPAGPLLVIGAGAQASAHAWAFVQGLGVTEVFVCSRSRDSARNLARALAAEGVRASDVAAPEDVLDRTGLIVTATTSPVPVLPEAVRHDAFIAAVGVFQPEKAEVPAGLVRRAELFVDTLEDAPHEAGDLLLAGVDWSAVTPLEAVPGRRELPGPVLYKSVGHAVLDLAAARLALGFAR